MRNLGDTPCLIAEETDDRLGFVAMLRQISKVFSTRDIIKEYVSCRCWPLKSGWSIKGWLPEDQWVEGIPMPDFVKSFRLWKEQVNPSSMESWADEILGAESISEYKLIIKQLGGTRTNRVFRALGIIAPDRAASVRHKAVEEKRRAKAVAAVNTTNAQDLALKSFITTRCAAHWLEAEASSSARVAELEKKVAALEREKLELQDAAAKKDEALAAVLDEASAALMLKDKYCSELAAAQKNLSLLKPMPRRWKRNVPQLETSSVGTARASPVGSIAFRLMFLGY
ncbi:hypothetical protein C2845_PM17G09020 [Panicum miliaceum]|uniref:Uncharacterized protein n=1 Tax=Panicum miliaceum TaxID=4540 RepID=A0A3L6Q1X6_PANMI|nr:hypothetical protein C2845_PM17G09020 [Panicum miliaceum]